MDCSSGWKLQAQIWGDLTALWGTSSVCAMQLHVGDKLQFDAKKYLAITWSHCIGWISTACPGSSVLWLELQEMDFNESLGYVQLSLFLCCKSAKPLEEKLKEQFLSENMSTHDWLVRDQKYICMCINISSRVWETPKKMLCCVIVFWTVGMACKCVSIVGHPCWYAAKNIIRISFQWRRRRLGAQDCGEHHKLVSGRTSRNQNIHQQQITEKKKLATKLKIITILVCYI